MDIVDVCKYLQVLRSTNIVSACKYDEYCRRMQVLLIVQAMSDMRSYVEGRERKGAAEGSMDAEMLHELRRSAMKMTARDWPEVSRTLQFNPSEVMVAQISQLHVFKSTIQGGLLSLAHNTQQTPRHTRTRWTPAKT